MDLFHDSPEEERVENYSNDPLDLDYDDEDQDSIFDPADSERNAPSQHSSAPTSVVSAPRSASPSRKRRKKIHPCPHPDCSKTYTKASKLEEHYRIHTNDRPFVCPTEDCFKTFLRKEHLQRHVTAAHTDVRRHTCNWEGCEKGFITATRLKRHIEMHEKNAENTHLACQYEGCNRVFRKQETLDRHINADHLGVKPYQCGETILGRTCTASFETRNAWKAHVSRAHGSERYWCDICEEQGLSAGTAGFTVYADLQRHTIEVHPPVCEYCHQTFARQHNLRDHLNTTHNVLSPDQRSEFFCPEPGCGRGFTRQSNMKNHMRSYHANKKPFVCGETDLSESYDLEFWDMANACEASFTSKQSLERHARSKHVGKVMGAGLKRKRETRRYRQPQPSALERLTGMKLEDYKDDPEEDDDDDDDEGDQRQFWIGGLSDEQLEQHEPEPELFLDPSSEPGNDPEYAAATDLVPIDPALT